MARFFSGMAILLLMFFAVSNVWAQTPEKFVFEVTTTAANPTFRIPLSGNAGSSGTAYNWNINWGDGSSQTATNASGGVAVSQTSAGIQHAYTTAGTYTITITPNGSTDAWLRAFGFHQGTNGANVATNKAMVTKVISPLTPLMTRTQAQINSNSAVNYEWAYTFYGCVNLTMGDNFTFAPEWDNITTVGSNFAYYMFTGVTGESFNMNSVFNLPKNITTVGTQFAYSMFQGITGANFNMNSVFNLPKNITTVGNEFAYDMFLNVTGASFKINEEFKFPLLSQTELNKSNVFNRTFYNLNTNIANRQNRSIESIVNGNPLPNSNRSTFGNNSNSNNTFIDRPYAPTQWGGANSTTIPIPTQPAANTTIAYGEEASLSVVAPNLPTITYQWYSNTTNGNSGGMAIDGATSATLSITPNAGTYYYYCVASGTSWGKTVSATSNVAVVTVTSEKFVFEVTVAADATFSIPLSGNNGTSGTAYNWNINWGDGSAVQNATNANGGVAVSSSSAGIPHTYTTAGTYTITITPNGSTDAWLRAFGFYSGANGANATANKAMVTKVISPLTPLMTRTQTEIDNNSPVNDEWFYTFAGCVNLTMGQDFTFAQEWENITTVGDRFAIFMFSGVTGENFNMNSVFNLPQGITTVGDRFATSMFSGVTGANFNMNSVFNLPQGITTVGDFFATSMFSGVTGANFNMNSVFNLPPKITSVGTYFADGMFYGVTGASFTMNSVFNLPQGITTVGTLFAYGMFSGVTGASFTMNSVFNLPPNITTVGSSFASNMFYEVTGANFNMNSVFNLPQGIKTVGIYFAYNMFNGVTGANFKINEKFKFPNLSQNEVTITGVFDRTFYNLSNALANRQNRTIESIVNGNSVPGGNKYTFGTSNNTFIDHLYAPTEWGGDNSSAMTMQTQPAANTTIAYGEGASLSVVAPNLPTITYQWYSNTTNSNSGGTAIDGATSATLSITPNAGTHYYYCVASATSWGKSLIATSNVATVKVNPKALSIETATHTRVYDGTTTATDVTVTLALSGKLSEDHDVTPNIVTAAYQSKNVGALLNISEVTLQGADAGNYVVTPANGFSVAGITKLQLVVNELDVEPSKVYDGTTTAQATVTSSNKIKADDDLEITTTATYNSKDVADATEITVVYSINNTNYTKPVNSTTAGTINPLQLTIANPNVATAKTYDGNDLAIATAGALENVVSGDEVEVEIASATYNSKDVADATEITVVYSIDNDNYTKPVNYTIDGTINPLQLTIANPAVTTAKTYDGNDLATATAGALGNVVGEDAVNVSIESATYNSKDVADATEITVVYSIDNTNYTKPVSYTTPGTITAKALTISGVTATSRDYNGEATVELEGGEFEDGIVNGDVVNFVLGTGTMANANAGANKPVTTSITLNNANYALSAQPAVTVDIAKLQLAVTGTQVSASKTYDGNDETTVIVGSDNRIASDTDLEITASATYNSANVTEATEIAVAYSIANDNGNYLTPASHTIDGTITEKALTITGVTATNRAYNGETTVELEGGVLEGIVNGDEVTFVLGTGIIDANAGANKAVTTDIALDGTASGNYSLTQPTDLEVTISPATLANITITATTKAYDGTELTPTVTWGAEVLVKGTDYTIAFTGTNGTNAGSGTFTLTGIGNYTGTKEVSFTIDFPIAITKKSLTITANNITVTQGDNAPAYTVSYEGFVDGDSESVLSGELKFTSSYNSNSDVGTYAIVPSGLSSEKYNISFVSGKISVLPAPQITLKETGTAEDISFEIPEELKSNNKFFIKANTNCKIDKADLQIPYINEDPFRAEVNFNGIDTVFTAERKDTIIIISPIPYEKLIRQKWGMLIVNNNPLTNGGYKFTEFNWKIGGEELHSNNLQYYRASDFGETLHPEIPVKVQLKTREGIEISSCEGNPTEIEASPELISAKKQVLGLDNKKPAANAKIYNVKGKRTTGNKIPAGVYIVEEGKSNLNEVSK